MELPRSSHRQLGKLSGVACLMVNVDMHIDFRECDASLVFYFHNLCLVPRTSVSALEEEDGEGEDQKSGV